MAEPPLIIDPELVGRRAKMTIPLSTGNLLIVSEAIRDAQADVEAYLRRPITPQTIRETGQWPWPDGWHLSNEVIEILDALPEDMLGVPTGYYTVVYTTGLDAERDDALRPIRRYVAAAALNSPEVAALWTINTGGGTVTGDVKSRSVSTDGQSISETFADGGSTTALGGGGKPGTGVPGALPSIESLEQWKLRGVFQRRDDVGGDRPWWR